MVFDAFGRVSGIMDPTGFPTTATFDALGRAIAVQDALGHVNSTLFDTIGQVQATVNALGNTSTTVYDSSGRPLAQVNELGCRTTFGYDQRGGRIAVTNARGFTWTATFDALGRNSASVDPVGRRTTFSFDARSQITQQTDGKGQVETRTYDALGRQTGTLYTNGKIVTTTFDLLGRKTVEGNENGTWTRTYDALGQRLTEVGPGYPSGLPLTSIFDSVGNRTALQTWRGVQTWGYDALNRSRTLVDIEGGTYTWSYEPRGYLNRLDYPNGVIFSVAYGSTGRPWQGSYSSAADSQVELVEYSAYDAVDNPTTMHQYFGGTHGNGRAMSYDAANQLTYWSDSDTEGPTAVFDPAGNPSGAKVGGFTYSYTYDAADELVNLTTVQPYDPAFTSATFSYDANGNRTGEQFFQSFTGGPRTDLTTYTWDTSNRLLSIKQSAVGAVDLTNSYRPDGLRHQRTDNSGTTQILWDGDEPLAQVDTLGNLQRYWSRAGAPASASWMAHWSRLVKGRLPGNPFPDQYLHADAQGTILAVSGSNGAALTHNQPPPRVWGMDGTLIAPFSWEGEHGYWYEGQLARPMHYVRARWFVDGGPGIGGAPGWLSPDPLRFGGGDWNLYRYVGNRPTVGVDPSGLFTCTVTDFYLEWVGAQVTSVSISGSQYSVLAYQLVRHVAKVECMGQCSERVNSQNYFAFWQYAREIDASKRNKNRYDSGWQYDTGPVGQGVVSKSQRGTYANQGLVAGPNIVAGSMHTVNGKQCCTWRMQFDACDAPGYGKNSAAAQPDCTGLSYPPATGPATDFLDNGDTLFITDHFLTTFGQLTAPLSAGTPPSIRDEQNAFNNNQSIWWVTYGVNGPDRPPNQPNTAFYYTDPPPFPTDLPTTVPLK